VRDNRKTHDEDIAQTLEAINSLSITEVVSGTPDYTARSGSQYGSIQGATGSHDGSNLGSGQDERQPKRRKTSGNGGEGEGEGQSQGDKVPGGGKDPLVCSLCQHRSQTLDALL